MNHKIANASFFAAMMVAAIHTAGRQPSAIDEGTALWWLEVVGHYGVFLIAVPFFFICSGYFLAGHMEEREWFGRECMKRVRTLLIPYIIWSLVYAMIPLVTFFVANLLHGRIAFLEQYASMRFWVNTFGLNPFAWPRLVPLWYVRSLFFFVAISPLLYHFIKRVGLVALFVLAVLSFAVGYYGLRSQDRVCLVLTKSVCVSGLFFFCCGVYGRLKRIRLPNRGQTIALVLGLCLAVANGYCRMSGIKFIIPLWVPLLLFGLWRFVPEHPLPKWLTNATFAIYVLHAVIYKILGIAFHFRVETIPQWLVKWMGGVSGSMIVAMALRRCCPKLAGAAFGGR